jgi:hypothetical protein
LLIGGQDSLRSTIPALQFVAHLFGVPFASFCGQKKGEQGSSFRLGRSGFFGEAVVKE